MKKFLLFFMAAACFSINAAELKKITPSPAAWNTIEKTDFTKWVEGGKPDIPTCAQIAYDDNRLYIKVTCTEPNLNEARQSMRFNRHDAEVWINECVEIFIANEQKTTGYYQFVVDVHNAGAELRHGDPTWPSAIKWNGYWSHSVEYTDTSFTVFAAIPWKTINVAPGKNQDVWVNISRMRKIHPWGRSVFSTATTKKLHGKEAFIHFGKLDIAAPVVTGSVSHGTALASDNNFSCTLENKQKKALSGKLELLYARADGSEVKLFSKPLSLPAGKKFSGKFTYRMPVAGTYPVRLTWVSNGKSCDIWGDNLSYSVPLEIGEPRPIVTAGKDHSILASIFVPLDKSSTLQVTISDANGKKVAERNITSVKKQFFFAIPSAKLATGNYKLTVKLFKGKTENFKQEFPVLIVPAVF